jgi:hypothetical protein
MENNSCNMMCLLSEWDENKPRDCPRCSGRFIEQGETLLPLQIEQTEAQDKEQMERTDA